MQRIAFAVVALLAVQAVAAHKGGKDAKDSKDSYGSAPAASTGYGSGSSGYATATVAVAAPTTQKVMVATTVMTTKTETRTKTEVCRQRTTVVTADPTLSCGAGYTANAESNSCTKEVCQDVQVRVAVVTPAPAVVVAATTYGQAATAKSTYGSAPAPAKASYHKGKSAKDSKDSYGSAPAPASTGYTTEVAAAPTVTYTTKTEKRCTTERAAMIASCAAGYTFTAGKCTQAAVVACGNGFESSGNGLCSKTSTYEVTVQVPTTVMVERTVEVAAVVDPATGYGKKASSYGSAPAPAKASYHKGKKGGKGGKATPAADIPLCA